MDHAKKRACISSLSEEFYEALEGAHRVIRITAGASMQQRTISCRNSQASEVFRVVLSVDFTKILSPCERDGKGASQPVTCPRNRSGDFWI